MLPKKIRHLNLTSARALRIGIVAAQYNSVLVDTLLGYTKSALSKHGVRVVRVPGSYEIPIVVAKLARSKKFDSIIALGIVFQGKTTHADHITLACTINLQKISIETGVPVIHQILTPKNIRDAKDRLKIRGMEAAQTAIQMAQVMREL